MKNYSDINFFFLRSIMGINMLIHGAVRLFGDYQAFTLKMEAMFEPTLIPSFLITLGANLISPIEFIFGLMLLVGFKTKISLIVLNLNMMLLITGVCLLQKWELAGLQMAYVLYLFFIGQNLKYNNYSIDSIIDKNKEV